jgi:hypothetical protein
MSWTHTPPPYLAHKVTMTSGFLGVAARVRCVQGV